ncbi:MAG: hypothetical protein KDK59_11185, partial [Simkania sp.]|nr:hypothetical protein [Simkania sp.]
MKVSEFKLRLASEAILISVVVYFAKKKRIIRYISLVEDATFCGACSTMYYLFYRVLIIFSEVPRQEVDFIVCDRYYSLQTPIQREWMYLPGFFKFFLYIYPLL